jgi:hypothetical protein
MMVAVSVREKEPMRAQRLLSGKCDCRVLSVWVDRGEVREGTGFTITVVLLPGGNLGFKLLKSPHSKVHC